MRNGRVTVFLCGDVMLGRGVDQILAHPGDPELRERSVRDARTYVGLAERLNGSIMQPVDHRWPWGDALPVLDRAKPDARVVNLETSVTLNADFAANKGVHYRMNPANLPCLAVARPDACVLANNHVLDFGRRGLADTLDALSATGLDAVGAGRNLEQARRPAVITVDDATRVLLFAVGMASSGVPPEWAATHDRAGVDFLTEPSEAAGAELGARVRRSKRPGDVAIVSVHWGPNWGFGVTREETRFAHRLIDMGVDVVYGHSSHHPRTIEVYRGKLILYGCGDLIDDYEGISGYEEYRDDLRLLYFASIDPAGGEPAGLTMVPMQARRMRLHHASDRDGEWMRAMLDRVSREFGSRIDLGPDGELTLRNPELPKLQP